MRVIHAARALTCDGWRSDVRIEVAGGKIRRLEFGAPAEVGDERHDLVLPALANLHSHAFQRAMAGLAERRGDQADDFWTWRETMYQIALQLGPEDVEAIAAQAYLEMLESGFASVAEFHYLHHGPDGAPYGNLAELAERIAAAASATGIGLTLLPVFYAHATFGGAAPGLEQRRFINDLYRYENLVAGCRRAVEPLPFGAVGVAPHSLRAATPEELVNVAALASGGPIHIHIAEQTREVDDCVRWSGARPVQWLLDHADVDERWCLVHATHMDTNEARKLAQTGAVAGLCPITEANLGDGVFPLRSFLDAGGRFGVGSDSNVEIGAAEELKMLEYAQRLQARARNVAPKADASTGRTVFASALVGGAQALRRDTGRLERGAVADLVSLKAQHPALAGRADDAVLDSWVFVGGRALVDCVWSAGVKVVAEGRHFDRDAVSRRFVAVALALAART
jgi:formimidoylglutamate deiminase